MKKEKNTQNIYTLDYFIITSNEESVLLSVKTFNEAYFYF